MIPLTLTHRRQRHVLVQRVTSPQPRKEHQDATVAQILIRLITIIGVKRLVVLHLFTMQAVSFIQVRQATRRVHLW